MAVYLCQARLSVLSKEAGSMQDSANQISSEIKYYLFLEQKERSENIQKFSCLRNKETSDQDTQDK